MCRVTGDHVLRRCLLILALPLVVSAASSFAIACESLVSEVTVPVDEIAYNVSPTILSSDTTGPLSTEAPTSPIVETTDPPGPAATTGPTSTTLFIRIPTTALTFIPVFPLEWTRFEEDDPCIYNSDYYSPDPRGDLWEIASNPLASGGRYMWTDELASIEIHFKGTGIAVLVLGNTYCCKIRLSLDDGAAFLVDPYGLTGSAVLWTSPDLPYGRHKIFIETTNVHNPASGGYSLMFDAVSVRGELLAWQFLPPGFGY